MPMLLIDFELGEDCQMIAFERLHRTACMAWNSITLRIIFTSVMSSTTMQRLLNLQPQSSHATDIGYSAQFRIIVKLGD